MKIELDEVGDVVERSATDVRDMFCEGKVGVKDDAEVASVRGWFQEGILESDRW